MKRVGLRRDDLVDDRAEIGGARGIGFVEHDVESGLVGLVARRGQPPPWRTDRPNRPGDAWLAGSCALSASTAPGEVMVGRGDDLEQILVAELVGLGLGAAGDQHDLAVLLADHRRGRHQARGIGAEQELRLVLDDEAGIELLHAAALGLVVIGDEAHLVVLVARLDAAGGVDLVAPHLGAALLRQRIDIERAGLRHRHADGDRVLVGGESRRRGDDRRRRNQAKRFHSFPPCLCRGAPICVRRCPYHQV